MRTTVPYLQKRFFVGRFGGQIVQPPPGAVGITASFGAVNVNAAAATAVTFVIGKSPDITLNRVVVAWSIAGTGVNPVTGGDFVGAVLPGNSIVIPAGTPSATVTVTFAAEAPPAANRTGHLTLAVVSGAVLDPNGNGFDFQVNKVGINSTVRVSSSFSTVDVTNGGTTTKTFVISKSSDLLGTSVAVPWSLTATGANPVTGADFQGGALPSGTATVAAGSPSATVSVVFAAEAPPASAETGHVAITAPTGISVDPLAGSFDFQVNASGATGLVGISASFATVDVTASGTTAKTFTIAKSPDILNSAVTVPWALTGTGTNPVHGSDFQGGSLPSGTATLGVGTATATVTITFAAEAPPATLEAGHVALGTPTGAVLDTAHAAFDFQVNAAVATGTVGVTLSFAAVDVDPNTAATATVTVSKSSGIRAIAVTVPWAITATGAAPVHGSDFSGGVLPTGNLVIPAGSLSANITITFALEAPPAAAETGHFALGTPSAGATVDQNAAGFDFQINAQVIQPPQTTVGVASSFSSVTVDASAQTVATVDVAKAGVTNIACTVDWAVTADPSAAHPVRASDFAGGVFPSGTLSIGAALTHKALSLTFVAEAPPANDLGGLFTLTNPQPAANVKLDSVNYTFSFVINKKVVIGSTYRSGLKWASGQTINEQFNTTTINKVMGEWEAYRGCRTDIAGSEHDSKTYQAFVTSIQNKGPAYQAYYNYVSHPNDPPSLKGMAINQTIDFMADTVTSDANGFNDSEFDKIANGDYDSSVYIPMLTLLNGYNRRAPFVIRLGHEWNATERGAACNDSTCNAGTNPARHWRAAWRHMANLIKTHITTAPLPLIDWNCTRQVHANGLTLGLDAYYPGDDVVDIVGVDFYFNKAAPDSSITSQATFDAWANLGKGTDLPVGIRAWMDYARGKGKLFGVGEWAVTSTAADPRDNPWFIDGMYRAFRDNQDICVYDCYFQKLVSHLLATGPGTDTPTTINPLCTAKYKADWTNQPAQSSSSP